MARFVADKLATTLLGRPWPLQPDHVRLTEGQLHAWADGPFEITERRWSDAYLTLVLQRRPIVSGSTALR